MKNAFMENLISPQAHKNHKEKLKPYEILIGTWDFDWVGHESDGSTWTVPGEWHFSWVLEGRAIQDVWICPKVDLRSSGKYPDGEYGTAIRFFDFKEDCIKVVWIGPILSLLKIFNVKQEDGQLIQDEIVIGDSKKFSRWVYKNISESAFKWESYISIDNRKTWQIDQEVFAKRKF